MPTSQLPFLLPNSPVLVKTALKVQFEKIYKNSIVPIEEDLSIIFLEETFGDKDDPILAYRAEICVENVWRNLT
jgi:hypothetical protein